MKGDIKGWLANLGLAEHFSAFIENGVDEALLPELNNEDLKDLGVSKLKDRKILLAAIAKLGKAVEGNRSELARDSSAQLERARAERRQLTVMFVDLVGSTELAAKLDPEELSDVIRAYQTTVAGEIGRLEGHVAKFMGDGVLAYFGWPQVHEDEAARAVAAALDIVAAVSRLVAGGRPLSCRIGIATGLVVVGELIGTGSAQEETVVGETPNLAARLQSTADANQIVIAEATHKLVGAQFEVSAIDGLKLKGIAQPVTVYRVIGEKSITDRFEARSGPDILPMFGRDQELALLLERWSQAKVGEAQGVLLIGEAGIGKSRITRAMLDAVANETHFLIRYQCSPYHTDSALWPVATQLSESAEFADDDPTNTKLDKLEALLDQSGNRAGAPLIADLLGLPSGGRYNSQVLTPQAQRAKTLDTLVGHVVGLAGTQPVLVVLEDVHWIDPTTFEFVELALDRIGTDRVLMLLTSRPDNQPPLAGHPHVTRLTLNRLGRASVEAIVKRLGGDALPAETINAIIARTDGMPLYLEELTKAVVETGETAIPASLHDSLMARLDRLSDVKETAQAAACIGREFDHSLLAAISDPQENELSAALAKLTAAELVFRRGSPPDARYMFKHALVRDAAYESLLKSRRSAIHGQIAQALMQQATNPKAEIIAQHAEAAGWDDVAIEHWSAAGRNAAGEFANIEAVRHITSGLKLVRKMPSGQERDQRELDLLTTLGVPLIAIKGYASPEVEETYSSAQTICARLGNSEAMFTVLRGLWNCVFDKADLKGSLQLANQLVALASEQSEHEKTALAYRALGSTQLYRGEFESAHAALQFGVEASRQLTASSSIREHGEDPTIVFGQYDAWALTMLGNLDQGLGDAVGAFETARASGHPISMAFAGSTLAILHSWLRRPLDCKAVAAEVNAVCVEHALVFWNAHSKINAGWALAMEGQHAEGLALLRDGIEAWRATGAALHLPTWSAFLAEAALAADQINDARAAVDAGMGYAQANGEFLVLAELQRLLGQVLEAGAERDKAIEAYETAIDTARRQNARFLELRATCDFARLLAAQDDKRRAAEMLTAIYGRFDEGLEMPDLATARQLIASI